MKQSHNWANRELNSLILLKSPEKSVVLTTVHKGIEVSSFQSHDSLTLQVIEGKLNFKTHKNSLRLDKGEILTLHEKIQYKFTSMEESVFLLTLESEKLQRAENR